MDGVMLRRVVVTLTIITLCYSQSLPPFLPNFYWVGSGFDSRNASSLDIGAGIKQQVIQYSGQVATPDGHWSLPTGLTGYPYPACTLSTKTKTIYGASALQTEISECITTSIGIGSLYTGSTSTLMYQTVKEAQEFTGVAFDSWVVCETYNLALNIFEKYNLTSEFISAIQNMPTKFIPGQTPQNAIEYFEAVMKNFGDTLVVSADEGGILTQRAITTAYTAAKLQTQGTSVSQQAQVHFEVSIGESVTYNTSSTSYQQFSSNSSFTSVSAIGGDPGDSSSYQSWVTSLNSEPVPIIVHLAPLTDLLNSLYFPNDASIEEKSQAYSNFTQWYLETQSQITYFYPFFNLGVGQGGEYTQASTVGCPSGTILFSGGCSSTGINLEDYNYPWKVVYSYPNAQSNIWECYGGTDYGSSVTYQDSLTYSICSPSSFTVTNSDNVTQAVIVDVKYVETFLNITSEIGLEAVTVSGKEVCPSGYYVVGGGCKVSTVTGNNNNEYPWLLRKSFPVDESGAWECFAYEDWGDQPSVEQTLSVFQVCASWSSSLTYLEDVISGYNVVSCRSNTAGYDSNYCTAVCPSGYQLTGGGCDCGSMPMAVNSYGWHIISSIPQNNGWYCSCGFDSEQPVSSDTTNLEVVGKAICVKF